MAETRKKLQKLLTDTVYSFFVLEYEHLFQDTGNQELSKRSRNGKNSPPFPR